MISLIKSLSYTLLICAVVCAFCETLVNSARLKNTIRVILSLFVMMCAVSPLTASNGDKETAVAAISPVYDVEAEATEKYVESLEITFEKYLKENFSENARVGKIYTSKDANGNIYITEVVVFSVEYSDALEKIIRKEFGENAVLVCR